MPEPLQLAVVGCGGIAGAYLQALAAVPELRVAALVDPDPARTGPLAAQLGVPAFADVTALLGQLRTGLHAALVLTPPSSHSPLACTLLAAGLHVLCEKPLAHTLAAAERMVAAATVARRVLMMGSKFRYTDDVVLAQQALQQGAIGQLVLYENVFCTRVDMQRRWHSVSEVSGGGVLIDNGSHSIDLARLFMGPLTRILAQFGPRLQPVPVEDTARILFESRQGAMGTVDLSWSIDKHVPSYVRLYGSNGAIEIGWQRSRIRRGGAGEWEPFGSGYDKVTAFRNQLQNFAVCARGEATPRITDADALASVRAIDRAYESVRQGRWLEIG